MTQRGIRLLSRASLAAMLLAAVAFVLSVFFRDTEEVSWLFDLGCYNLVFVAAASLAFCRSQSPDPRTRPWLVFAAGLLIYAIGGVFFTIDSFGLGPHWASAIADLCWIAFYPLALVALLLLTRRRLSLVIRYGWLDALFLGTGAFSIGLALLNWLLLPDLQLIDPDSLITNSLYVIGDLVLFALVLGISYSFHWRIPAAWWLMLFATLSFAVADALYLFLSAGDLYVEGGLIDIAWVASGVLFGLAAYLDRQPAPAVRRFHSLAYLVPATAVILVGVVLVWRPAGPVVWLVIAGGFITLVLATLRLALSINEAWQLTEDLRLARIDLLTGLLNRSGLQHRTDRVTGRDVVHGSVVVIDLDAFTDVNVSLGHDAGDRLLMMVADRMIGVLDERSELARIGGDGFAVYLPDADSARAVAIADSLAQAIERGIVVDSVPVRLTACGGVSTAGQQGSTLDLLLRYANDALASAKQAGPGTVRAYGLDQSTATADRLRIRSELQESMDAGGADFIVEYQPIVRLSDGSVFAVEALVRWNRDGEILGPGAFLDEVMKSGTMARLTWIVMDRALSDLRRRGIQSPVTVNVSPDLVQPYLVEQSLRILEHTQSSPEQLIIEITEDALLRDPDSARPVVEALRDHGIKVLLDDFGTGWSGLASLRDLIVDGLKLDHTFVSRMSIDDTAKAVVQAVSRLANDLDVQVIYEGAEDEAVLELLCRNGVGHVQGFAICRPMGIEALAAWRPPDLSQFAISRATPSPTAPSTQE